MARILVRYPKSKTYRLWCNTIDQWVSVRLSRAQMIDYLINELDFERHTERQAIERVDRIGYKHRHKLWLNKYFDNRIRQLCASDRRHRGVK